MTEEPDAVRAALELLDQDEWTISSVPGSITLTRAWADGSVDTLFALSPETAVGRRDDPNHRLVWLRDGAIGDVASALNALPAPGKPQAPDVPLPEDLP